MNAAERPVSVDNGRISVVIPVFNCEKYVAEAIRSVLAQSRPPEEIIVVDDGSTDSSADVVKTFGTAVQYVWQTNQKIGAARNAGVAIATGNYIAFLDADDIWMPNKLELQSGALCAAPDVHMVFGKVRHFRSPELDPEISHRFHCPAEEMPGINAASMLVRRTAFDRIGRFDTNLTLGEFLEWYARALDQGLQSLIIDEVILLRRVHSMNTGIQSKDSRQDYVRLLKAMLDRRRGGENR